MRRAAALVFSTLGTKRRPSSRNLSRLLHGSPSVPQYPRLISSQRWPSRALQTVPDAAFPLPSHRRQRPNDLADLEETFEAASTTDEILSGFRALEASLDPGDKRLGLACLKVGQHLDSIGSEDHEKVLTFGLRALRILDVDGGSSISVVMALHVSGSASYNLRRFNDSLGFLNRANRILNTLESEGIDGEFDVRPVSHAVQLQLANTKTAMGRREEALVNLRRCLDLKVSILEPNSRELGTAHRDLAEAYACVLNFKEALPLCLKALEIHKVQLGQNSVEVAHDRRLLGVIYTGLEEHDKAMEQNQLSQKIMKSWGVGGSDLLNAEIDAANIHIALGKYDEAINTLKGVVEQTDSESETRALVFVSMAKALCNQKKFPDAKRCLEISCGIFEKKEYLSPEKVADAYMEIASLYESMNDFETAICLLKRSLAMVEKIPREQHVEGNVLAKIGWLLLLTGKVAQGIPYLESAAERMKESSGLKNFGVGYIYNNLGPAYMKIGRPQSAAQKFALAKDNMDVSLGPHHADSIETCRILANAYQTMGSYALDREFQQQVVAWRSHGSSAKDELEEAAKHLKELKKKAFGSLTEVIQEALSLASRNDSVPSKDG
ncbi:TPR [Musa troglodytarum]|uniref:TPR n=1 Tax=Musa troglodytarum TaxID=320322 RepID=A0A9E7HNV2_9LILI|nr:TPR [Musa troglodytarum]